MDKTIRADLFRYSGKTGIKGWIQAFFIPGFRYTYFMRKAAKWHKYSPPGIWYRLLLRRYSIKYGFQISPNTAIGEGLYIGHFGAIVINPMAKLGKHCNITSGVTIGQTNRGKLKGYPVIGDKVWIGSNSTIVGGIRIGSNVMIAPNSFVNFDVPDNSLVIGSEAKVIAREDPTASYIEFILD